MQVLLLAVVLVVTGAAVYVQPKVQGWWDRHPPREEG